MRVPPFAAIAFVGIVLGACAGSDANRDSAEYQAGYGDGCATGGQRGAHIQGEPQRDQALYEKSSDYRAGWASGYNVCGAGANPGHL
jgi:hypothetical protein